MKPLNTPEFDRDLINEYTSGELQDLLMRLYNWYAFHSKVISVFEKSLGSPRSYGDIRALLTDLSAPCNQEEKYIVCHLLDYANTGSVTAPLSVYTIWEGAVILSEKLRMGIVPAENIRLLSSPDTWVQVVCRMINHPKAALEPFRVTFLAPTWWTMEIIVRILENRILPSFSLALYDNEALEEPAVCPADTLADMGYAGGSRELPEKAYFFFIDDIGCIDQPLLIDGKAYFKPTFDLSQEMLQRKSNIEVAPNYTVIGKKSIQSKNYEDSKLDVGTIVLNFNKKYLCGPKQGQ